MNSNKSSKETNGPLDWMAYSLIAVFIHWVANIFGTNIAAREHVTRLTTSETVTDVHRCHVQL